MSALLGESAVRLPWLAPSVASLVALARPHSPDAWSHVRSDPAALLLLLRHAPPAPLPPQSCLTRCAPAAVGLAHDLLARPRAGTLGPAHWAVRTVLAVCDQLARVASRLAPAAGADPVAAWVAGLLAPLGWLAAAATDPDATAACLTDSSFARQPEDVQRRHWGSTAAEIARRLARRWHLPDWLATVVGNLHLPAELAAALGADRTLFLLVQTAATLLPAEGDALRFAPNIALPDLCTRLGVDTDDAVRIGHNALGEQPRARPYEDPYGAPLLRDLLGLAAEHAGQPGVRFVSEMEDELDQLYGLLADQQRDASDRLRAQKLAALAEFAAGAGHEINNPLAVISGQAQYLLSQEEDPGRQKSLRGIVQQAQRIHQILTDLMQFARPGRPHKQAVEVRDLVLAVASVLQDWAEQRQVRVELMLPDEACVTDGDPKQLHTALLCLLRNAVEAAPAGGWARVRVEPSAERLRVVVEDSGAGPARGQHEHLFDPFYSGRSAGRGRGLGLPTAWRLAREQGGDVAYEPLPLGPTRFVLSLPRITTLPLPQPPERLSA